MQTDVIMKDQIALVPADFILLLFIVSDLDIRKYSVCFDVCGMNEYINY